MKRLRRLSRREYFWVQEAIRQLCACYNVSDRDEDYRSVAWTAFFTAYRRFHSISSPDFWPYAYEQIRIALIAEKSVRHDRVYRLVSLNAPVTSDGEETLLSRLPDRRGDFTNSVSFWDFLDHLPWDLARLATRLVNGDSLEEARSILGLSDQDLCRAVDQLRDALICYCAI